MTEKITISNLQQQDIEAARNKAFQNNAETEITITKLNYPLLAKELKKRGVAQKVIARDQISKLQEEIKALKAQRKAQGRSKDPEIKGRIRALREQILELRGEQKESRQEIKNMRFHLRVQARVLRKGDIAQQEARSELNKLDPWKTRLPYMQKLLYTHNNSFRDKYEEQISRILSEASAERVELLRDLLDDVMTKAAVQTHVIDINSVEATLRAIGKHAVVFLSSILNSAKLVTEATSDSYHHDLFEKSVLLTGKSSHWKLRMHVFVPETFTLAKEEIHSHRNHFVSYCLYGGLSQEIWEEPEHVNPPMPEAPRQNIYKYIYDPTITTEGNRVFNIHYQGQMELVKVQEAAVIPGQSYYMHPSVLHSVSGIDGCTVTLVWNSPLAVEKSCFGSYEPWEDESFERAKFTEDEMKDLLGMVIQLLQ